MSVRHLNQIELAARWNISPRTLERWRWLGEGPVFLKIGGRVLYRVDDVEAFEATQLRARTDVPLIRPVEKPQQSTLQTVRASTRKPAEARDRAHMAANARRSTT